jgi:hypothetical protein
MAYIGLSPVVGEFRKLDDISGQFDNSTSTFNLTVAGSAVSAGSAQNLIISVDGIIQEPQASFTVGGSTLSFTEAPNTASTFFGILLGSVAQVGTVSDGAITTEKIANGAITADKIADGTVIAADIADNAITTAKIIDNAVTTAKIADANVTTGKIADSAITSSKLSSNLLFNGTATFLGGSIEKANIVASNITSIVTIDPQVSGIVYFTNNTAANANVTVNFLGQSDVAVGNVSSFVLILQNNATSQAVVTTTQIEGQAGNVLKFSGGTPASTANIDIYSFSVIKTAASSYTILGSKSDFS